MGKYALENGPAAAFRKFQKDIPSLTQTSVRNFGTAYQRSLTSKERKLDFDNVQDVEILKLPTSKCGRKTLLDENMDEKLQAYLRALHNNVGLIHYWAALVG